MGEEVEISGSGAFRLSGLSVLSFALAVGLCATHIKIFCVGKCFFYTEEFTCEFRPHTGFCDKKQARQRVSSKNFWLFFFQLMGRENCCLNAVIFRLIFNMRVGENDSVD